MSKGLDEKLFNMLYNKFVSKVIWRGEMADKPRITKRSYRLKVDEDDLKSDVRAEFSGESTVDALDEIINEFAKDEVFPPVSAEKEVLEADVLPDWIDDKETENLIIPEVVDEVDAQEISELPEPPPQEKPKIQLDELTLSVKNLLRTIVKLSEVDVFMEYGFFDDKYVVPEEYLKIFSSAGVDEIAKMAKKLKTEGLLKVEQTGEIFAYPFMKRIALTELGFEEIA